MRKLLLFDIDGFAFHGKTDPAIVRALLRAAGRADAEIDAGLADLWAIYLGYLDDELAKRAGDMAVCAGVADVLAEASAAGDLALGLVTGNVEGGAWRKLRACGLEESFTLGAFGSDSEHREHLPPIAMRRAHESLGVTFEREAVMVIGDTPEDVRCAVSSGVAAVAVASGRFSAAELADHAPDHLFGTLADEGVRETLFA